MPSLKRWSCWITTATITGVSNSAFVSNAPIAARPTRQPWPVFALRLVNGFASSGTAMGAIDEMTDPTPSGTPAVATANAIANGTNRQPPDNAASTTAATTAGTRSAGNQLTARPT